MEMEVQGMDQGFEEVAEIGPSNESFQEGEESPRSKTSLRMHYEAQVAVIRRQTGDLESVRLGLGLSQRKMAQLLMVDPSAWTRWVKQGDEAPPHIWRALQWFSALQEKIPGLTPHYFINQSPQVLHQKALQELDQERSERQQEHRNLQEKLDLISADRAELQNSLQQEIFKLKKDLNFHKKMSIVILSLSIVWAAVLMVWKFA
ncbi:hypothetical protein [Bdellovibrio svalbardensis]|uniref:HTH cro/C1-type domain-containing protein n=1 Tax=Bdellovibrio svalbardensis TaxID=2972972 RepID=A0ABT6DID1_9BACT|nr:hypothetical protein [Bdellovibrio svalbardensis]MDG0816585.1 hypothetical protein [Bdellovibrio svalbardensis]